MNNSIAVFLINDQVRAVHAVYEPDVPNAKSAPRVTFKTLDRTIQKGDYVIVPTDSRHHMCIFQVTDVDVDIDFDSSQEVRWIIGRVDESPFKETVRKENEAISMIKSAEKRKKREEMQKALIIDQAAIKTLAISSAGEDPPAA